MLQSIKTKILSRSRYELNSIEHAEIQLCGILIQKELSLSSTFGVCWKSTPAWGAQEEDQSQSHGHTEMVRGRKYGNCSALQTYNSLLYISASRWIGFAQTNSYRKSKTIMFKADFADRVFQLRVTSEHNIDSARLPRI